jgi:hypothetical protein
MKKLIYVLPLLTMSLLFTGCSDDDPTPEPVNEEELITTLTVRLTDGDGALTTFKYVDLDGEGGDEAVVTVSGNLTANTTYSGEIELLNETESPAEDITEEVEEEADEHQFFYAASEGLNVTTTYDDEDGDGNPIGILFTLATGEASSGTFTFTLRHEPTKPNTGIDNAGGETDIEVTFDVTVQ